MYVCRRCQANFKTGEGKPDPRLRGLGKCNKCLDSAAAVSYNWNWVGHLNGNALYDLRDHAFRDFLRLVVQYEPPSHFWKVGGVGLVLAAGLL